MVVTEIDILTLLYITLQQTQTLQMLMLLLQDLNYKLVLLVLQMDGEGHLELLLYYQELMLMNNTHI